MASYRDKMIRPQGQSLRDRRALSLGKVLKPLTRQDDQLFFYRDGEPEPDEPAYPDLQEAICLLPDPLEADRLYRWRVVSRHPPYGDTGGDWWNLLTEPLLPLPPDEPANPFPPDGAADVAPGVTLGWDAAERAKSYSVYLWMDGELHPLLAAIHVVSNGWKPTWELEEGTSFLWQVKARSSTESEEILGPLWRFTTGTVNFRRGEVNDDGGLDTSDAIRMLLYFFNVSDVTIGCDKAADIDDSGELDLADVISLLGYLFATGAPPVPPFQECAMDFNPDGLSCQEFPLCP